MNLDTEKHLQNIKKFILNKVSKKCVKIKNEKYFIKLENITNAYFDDNFQIFYACYYKKYNIIKKFIINGVDLNIKDYFDYSPLMYSCILNDFKMAKLILENLEYKDINDYSINKPLFYACLNNNFDIVELLIENNYYNNIKNCYYILVVYFKVNDKIKNYLINNFFK